MAELVHTKGRKPSVPDPRDRSYPARRLLSADRPTRRYRAWYGDSLWIDQGRVGQCTTVSIAHIIYDGPKTPRPYYPIAKPFDTLQMYCRAQVLDGEKLTYCSRRNDTGATMRSAAQAVREAGFVSNFWWFEDVESALLYLTNDGPLWMGTWWYEGMEEVDRSGYIHATGERTGGHAYKIDRISWNGRWVDVKNSWGQRWGADGRAKLSFEDFGKLFSEYGEALAFTEIQRNPMVK